MNTTAFSRSCAGRGPRPRRDRMMIRRREHLTWRLPRPGKPGGYGLYWPPMSDFSTRSRPAIVGDIVGVEALTHANGSAEPMHNNLHRGGALNGAAGVRPWKVAAVIP